MQLKMTYKQYTHRLFRETDGAWFYATDYYHIYPVIAEICIFNMCNKSTTQKHSVGLLV